MQEKALLQKKLKKETNILNKRSPKEKVVFAIVFCLFMLYSLTIIFAIVWMFYNSLKGSMEYTDVNTINLPKFPPKFGNYLLAFELLGYEDITFFHMLFNSIWYTAVGVSLACIVPAVTGYVLAKYNFAGKQLIFTLAILSMTLPIVGAGAAYMRLIQNLSLDDSPLYVVVANMSGFGGTFLVYYAFFKSVSWSYAEAAIMDGADPFVIFFRIMLPQARPIILTYALTNMISYWNEYQAIILYIPKYLTIAAGLYQFKAKSAHISNFPVYFAGLLISMIPTLVLFSVFSGKIMTNLSIGGLKG